MAGALAARSTSDFKLTHYQGCPRTFDSEFYRKRNAVERCVGWLKSCRSIATQHEKPAINFAATVKLAFQRQYLRILRPSDRTWLSRT